MIIKKLGQKKYRDEHGVFLVEGGKFVREVPDTYTVLAYVTAEGYKAAGLCPAPREFFEKNSTKNFEVSDKVFAQISDTVTPQGILAVVERRQWNAEDISMSRGFVLAMENINDPGNVGGLIRTAAAAGAAGIVLSPGCADPFSPKAIRASAGAVLLLPVVMNCHLPAFLSHPGLGGPVYAAHAHGGLLPYELDMHNPFCLLIGSEAHGLSPEAIACATHSVKLPMPGGVESLNAAVAGSILIYEHVRQKQSLPV